MRAGEGGERDSCAGAGPVLRLHSAVDSSAASVHAARRPMNTGEASDEALMMAYRDGDSHAFQLLYARHRGGLYRFLLRQCGAAAIASCIPITFICLPLNSICLPTDLSEATNINSVTGKSRSASTFKISLPTKPVAPTTATFI